MDLAAAWDEKMDGRLIYRGRVGGRSPGCRSPRPLVVGCLVALLRNAVASVLYHYGCAATMSPRHRPGWQVVLAKGEQSRTMRLCMVDSPGLSRGIGQPRTRRSCAATPTALDLEKRLPSSTSTGWGKGSMASTAWPATRHGKSPGRPTSVGAPPPV